MSLLFFDSSALVKRYIAEQGTNWVRSLTVPSAGNTVMVAQILPVEVVSAAMRCQREGRVTPRTAQAVRLLVDRHVRREYLVIGLTEQVVHRAEDLLAVHPLRSYDAVQLASALEASVQLLNAGRQPLTFVTADQRLLEAAVIEKLVTDDPNRHVQ